MSRFHLVSVAFAALAVVAVACGGAAAPTATAAPAAVATATVARPAAAVATPTRATAAAVPTAVPLAMAKPSGRVVFSEGAFGQGVGKDFDPGAWQGGFRGFYRIIYEPLAYTDEAGNLESPILATSWKMAPDGLAWTFQLRKGVKFHNGEDFDAQVMVKNIKRSKGLNAPFYHQNVEGYETPDTHTMVIKLKGPDLGLIARLVYSSRIGYPAPAGYIDAVGEAGIRNHPIGTGPYKFVSADFTVGSMELEAWDGWGGYWGSKPTVQRFTYLTVPEQTTRQAMLATGEADIVALAAGPQLKELRGGRVFVQTSVAVNWLEFFNQADPSSPYGNLKVRQAMNYAVNKDEMIDKLFGGAALVSASSISPMQFGYDPKLQPYPFDPARAKQLLREAGYPDGFDGGVIYASSSVQQTDAEAVISYLAAVGIRTKVVRIDEASLTTRWRPPIHNLNLEKGMGFRGSSLAGDGAYRIESFFTKYGQWGYTVDPELDALYDKTVKVLDRNEYERQLQQLARMTNERAYKLFLWHSKGVHGLGPRIAEWKLTPGEAIFDNLQSIRLK